MESILSRALDSGSPAICRPSATGGRRALHTRDVDPAVARTLVRFLLDRDAAAGIFLENEFGYTPATIAAQKRGQDVAALFRE
ncbi:MAG TPA: hypothetical protein VKA59_08585 [Vicinamibacterales bacterium]|nr:hypothetical protein [Vicinamibacterales bacterium]